MPARRTTGRISSGAVEVRRCTIALHRMKTAPAARFYPSRALTRVNAAFMAASPAFRPIPVDDERNRAREEAQHVVTQEDGNVVRSGAHDVWWRQTGQRSSPRRQSAVQLHRGGADSAGGRV